MPTLPISLRPERLLLVPLAAATLGLLGCPGPATVPVNGVPAPPNGDAVFTQENAAALLAAVAQTGIERMQLAQERAADAEVRQFAQRMLTAYEAAQQELGQVLAAREISPVRDPTTQQLERGHQETMAALRGYEGAEFDHIFITTELELQRWLATAMDRALIPVAHDRRLRTLLEEGRPMLRESTREAEELRVRLGAT